MVAGQPAAIMIHRLDFDLPSGVVPRAEEESMTGTLADRLRSATPAGSGVQ